MSKKNQQKRYVVWKWKKTWIFSSWEEVETLVKWFSGAKYKSFDSVILANQAFSDWSQQYYSLPTKKKISWKTNILPFQKNSIAVDAACSGNPWIMEYQGIDLVSGKQIFYKKFDNWTNNIGEFLALVHALSYLENIWSSDIYIYTDSKIAMSWVKQKICKTQAQISYTLQEVITRAEQWLQVNTIDEQKILKWKTSERGEIPADFGRK